MQRSRHHRRGPLPVPARSRLTLAFAFIWFCTAGGPAWAQKADSPAPVGGGMVARVLAPAEKIKLLEEELAKESDKRMKLEDENSHRSKENSELLDNLKSAQKERAAVEARLGLAREHETQLQKTNDRLREETERVTVSVRYAMPIIAGVAIIMLALMVWMLLFLRQVAARVHGQRTLAEMHELEGRLIHTNDLLAAEVKRTQTLRNKLSELGVAD